MMISTKHCKPCGTDKSILAFGRKTSNRDGLNIYCRKCERVRAQAWLGNQDSDRRKVERKKQRDRWNENETRRRDRREWELQTKYGISVDDYDEMVMTQCGICVVCGNPETRTGKDGYPMRLVVHHNHITGKFVALCCNNCNVGMGFLKDSPVLLRAAADLNV